MYQAVKMFIPTVMRDILIFESTEEQLTHSSRTLEELQGGFFFFFFGVLHVYRVRSVHS